MFIPSFKNSGLLFYHKNPAHTEKCWSFRQSSSSGMESDRMEAEPFNTAERIIGSSLSIAAALAC
ncbi:hypothetical protein HOLDEFILI_03548 [Holdemania filiformis DSM 12042]|uniref:Uncharacterized protein n=1 Tax=Holdemania filiformis DSM 12042 TaxID=545696 RepID=B9YCI8_9FIRM|nr:hypothetical protein HOLDEFILI_03548 [Holdemania filiformis DSM 12042]